MIIYNRQLKKDDILNLKNDEELIFYRDNNIAYSINHLTMSNYIIRKKKIFNNELIDEKIFKTAEQIIKAIT